jgi:ATP-binding cassette subfamily F protein 3
VAAGYHGKPIIDKVRLTLQPGDRIGLLGHNGAGKSTLIKLVAGELAPLAGELRPAQELNIGYFAQHQLEQLDAEASPLRHLQRLDPKAGEQALRDYLGGFGFDNDMALSPVAPFSGGEKARLVLALLVYQRPNLLLLDEPTNHLDLEMRHALSVALQDYVGAMLIVSHDRHLLRSVTDTLLLVDSGAVSEFDGDLDDYRRWLGEQQREETPKKNSEADHSAAARKERKRLEAEQRQRLQPLRKELQALEKKLEALQQQKAQLEQQLAEPELYSDANKERLKQLLQEKGGTDQSLSEVEERWLSLSEELEQAGAG